LLEYWQLYGLCGYAEGLFWTVDPDEWEDELEAWVGDTPFMERDSFYVIARSAFGELILWGTNTGQSLKVVPIYGGIFPAFDAEKFQRRGPDKALQLFFGSASRATYDLEDDNKQSLFEQALKKLGPLSHDTGARRKYVCGSTTEAGRPRPSRHPFASHRTTGVC
jgi:hypothetical protein